MSRKSMFFLMFFAMMGWGLTWINSKVLNFYISPFEMIFWRFLFTSVGLLPIIFYKKLSIRIDIRNLFFSILAAIFLVIYSNIAFLGTKYGLAGFGGVLVTTLVPIFTFLLISLFSRKSIALREFAGLCLGFIGAMILLKVWNFNLKQIVSNGNIYFLIASILWPFVTLISAKIKNISVLVFSFYMYLFTSFFDLVYLKFELSNIANFDSIFWLNMFVLSLFGTIFSTTVYFFVVNKAGSKTASSFFFLVPLSAIIFSNLFLDEKISISIVVGGVLSVFAVYILNGIKLNLWKLFVKS